MSLPQEEFDFVRDVLRRLSGYVLEDGKGYLVEARLRALTRQEAFEDTEALLRALRLDAERGPLRVRMVESMLIGETRFFRDEHPFETLRESILPALIEENAAQRTLRIWSAACSTGQEPYSLAMLLADMPQLGSWNAEILATDLSSKMLERTEAGVYTDAEMDRGLPRALRDRWFTRREDGAWAITPRLRDRIRIQPVNLVEPWIGLPRMDLILIRNVLIYFDAETKRDVLRRAHEQLRPGGILLLGTSESLPPGQMLFEQMRHGRTIYYRRR